MSIQIKKLHSRSATPWALALAVGATLATTGWSASTNTPSLENAPERALDQMAAQAPLVGQSVISQVGSETQTLDSFQSALLSRFRAIGGLRTSMELRTWIEKIQMGHFQTAAHLWTAIQNKIPENFRQDAEATQLYLNWKLELSQTFIDQYLSHLSNAAFVKSTLAHELQTFIAPGFDQWLAAQAIELSPDQRRLAQRLGTPAQLVGQPLALDLQALSYLGQGAAGKEVLQALPVGNPLRIPFAETVALAHAKAKQLPEAARVLKELLEPSIIAQNDPRGLSHYYLQMARLLFQAGYMDSAEQAYLKIPNGVKEFIPAQEELTWVWLRKGDNQHVRGALETLSSSVFADRFSPELHLVRSISNLKLCRYDEMQKDFDGFMKENSKWAAKITAALKSATPPAPPEIDAATLHALAALRNRTAEAQSLQKLGDQSINAVLPAVGWQSHWRQASNRLEGTVETLQKQLSNHYRRQWKNYEIVLSEAITKMRFVKVEMLSQLSEARAAEVAAQDAPDATADEIHTTSAATLRDQPEDMTFPFDGIVWPDEMFKLKSVAESRCLKFRRAAPGEKNHP